MFQFLNRPLRQIPDTLGRLGRRRFWTTLALIALTLGGLALTPWTAQADEPGDIFAEAWQRVRALGAYEFRADIIQDVVPVPSVTNMGQASTRQELHIEGTTNLRSQALAMTLWSQGGNVLDPASGLELKLADGRMLARKGSSEWEEINNFTDALMPQGDFTTFLAGATDIKRVNEEATTAADTASPQTTHYTYRIDGVAFAAHLRELATQQMMRSGELVPGIQLDLPKLFTEMQGTGELWLRADGLPLRQLTHLKFPEQDGQWVAAKLDVTFQFAQAATAQTPSWTASLGTALANPSDSFWQTLILSLLVMAGSGLTLFVIVRRRSTLIYKTVAIFCITSIVAGPLVQTVQAEAAYKRIEIREARQNTLQADAEAMQLAAQAATQKIDTISAPETLALIRNDSGVDLDQDGLSDVEESLLGSDPQLIEKASSARESALLADFYALGDASKDSDGDGLNDREEELLGTNPESADSDNDTIPDLVEIQGFTLGAQTWHTDPREFDSNGDGQSDEDEWNRPGVHPTWDTNNDGVPDLFDRDNDGDRVPDNLDISPYRTWTTTFSAANPFELVVDGLTPGKTTFVEFQLRPTNPDHLWYALNKLDWPADNGGNLRDLDNSPDDLNLIPMLEVRIPSAPYNLPLLATPQVAISLTKVNNAPGGAIGGAIVLTQQGNNLAVQASLVSQDNSPAAGFLYIREGTCINPGKRVGGPVTVSSNGIVLNNFTQTKLRDRSLGGHIVTVENASGDPNLVPLNGCGAIPVLPFEGEQMIDGQQLAIYGVSVREADANRTAKLAYIPLTLLTDDPARLGDNKELPSSQTPRGNRVAFGGLMPYNAGAAWTQAHQLRLVWTVQMKTDLPCATGVQSCPENYNIPTVIHTYNDDWTLTGIDVREDRGANLAIAYEDPTVDANRLEPVPLLELAEGLNNTFMVGRTTGATRDITVDEIARRFNRSTNGSVSLEERFGIDNLLTVEKQSYPTLDSMVRATFDRSEAILAANFTTFWSASTPISPTLLYAYEWTSRALNLDLTARSDAVKWDAGGKKLTVSFRSDSAAPAQTLATLKVQPYNYNGNDWRTYDLAEFWTMLESFYAADVAADPEQEIARGKLRALQLYYLTMINGLQQTVQLGNQPLKGNAKSDTELKKVLSDIGKSTKAINFFAGKMLKAYLNDGLGKSTSKWEQFLFVLEKAYLAERGDYMIGIDFEAGKKNVSPVGKLINKIKNITLYNSLLLASVAFTAVLVFTQMAISLATIGVKDPTISSRLNIANASLTLVVEAYTKVWVPFMKGKFINVPQAGKTSTFAGLTDKVGSIKSAKIMAAVGLAITLGVAWGYFIYAIASGTVRNSVEINSLLAYTIATTIVALLLFAIAQIPIVGQIIAAVLAIIDAILTIICEAGVKELRGVVAGTPGKGSCFTLSGALGEFIGKYLYSADTIIDFGGTLVPAADRFPVIRNMGYGLWYPEAGLVAGNTLYLQATVGGSLPPKVPTDGKTFFGGDAYAPAQLEKTRVQATLSSVPMTLTLVPRVFSSDEFKFKTFTQVATVLQGDSVTRTALDRIPLYAAQLEDQVLYGNGFQLTPGINNGIGSALYLNVGMRMPLIDCAFTKLCGPSKDTNIYDDDDKLTPVSFSNPVITGTVFTLDILPATLDGFYARNWGRASGGVVDFNPAADFDGDGLRNTASGGLDPDDTKVDSDGDNLPDAYEFEYQALGFARRGGSINAQSKDTDGDTICDDVELQLGTQPGKADTDGDGLLDGDEVYHEECANPGVWRGGWIFTYNITNTSTVRINSDPRAADIDLDGMSDSFELALHAQNPGLYPYNPNIFTPSPIALFTSVNDDDNVVAPGATLVYTATVANYLDAGLLGSGSVTTTFPAALGGNQRSDAFLLNPGEARSFNTPLVAGAGSVQAEIVNNVAAQLLATQGVTLAGSAVFNYNQTFVVAIDADAPQSQVTGSPYIQAGGFRTIGGVASDPTSYIQNVEVRVAGQNNFTLANGREAWAYTWEVPTGDGIYTIESRARDAVDNLENPPASTVIRVDGTPPSLTTDQPSNGYLPTKRNKDGQWLITLSGSVSDPAIGGGAGSGVKTVEVLVEPRASDWRKATVNGNQWSISYPLSIFDANNDAVLDATGQYTVSVRATDNVENRTAPANQLRYQVRLETTPPTVALLSVGDRVSQDGAIYRIESTSLITQNVVLTGTASDPGNFASGVHSLEIAFTPAQLLNSLGAARALYYLNEPADETIYANAAPNSGNGICSAQDCPTNNVAGIYGTAAQFTGGDVIASTVNISETALSVSLWFNTSDPNSGFFAATAAGVDSSNADRSIYLTNGNLCAFVRGVQTDEICTAGRAYNDGQWHQAVLVLDQNAPFRLYVDGQAGATAGLVRASTLSAQSGIALGRGVTPNGTFKFLNGSLDEVEIYDATLSADAVAALYRRWQPVTLANPGATQTAWSYPVPAGLEGIYQIDMRSQDTVGNRNDDNRAAWKQWRGIIDTLAPRVQLAASFSGANATAQTTYNITIEDFNLTADGYTGPCAIEAADYGYDESLFWQTYSSNTPGLRKLSISCTVNGFPVSGETVNGAAVTACDIYGRCTQQSEDRDVLYWATTENATGVSAIRRANLNGGFQREELIDNRSRITGLAVDNDRGHLYWLERDTATTGRVQRSDLNGQNVTTIAINPAPVLSQVTFPTTFDLVVNAASGKLYWSEEDKIKWANLDGSAAATLFTLPTGPDPRVDRIGGMVVDTTGGKIYFGAIDLVANNGDALAATSDSQIWVMNADGSNASVLVDSTVLDNVVVIGLALAQDKTRLYWTQRERFAGQTSSGDGFYSVAVGGGTPVHANVAANNISFISILEVSPGPVGAPNYAYWSVGSTIQQIDLVNHTAGYFAVEPQFHLIGASATARIPGLATTASDLELLPVASAEVVATGGLLNYPVVVRNNGPVNASTASLVYTLPANTTFVAAGSSGGCSASSATTVTCLLTQLGDSSERSVTIQVQVNASAGSTLSASASVSSSQPDPKLANNNITLADVRVFAAPPPAPAAARYLYWGDGNSLRRMRTDGSSAETVVGYPVIGSEIIQGVVVDSVNGHVYFASRPNALAGNGYIRRVNLDGSGLLTIYTDDTAAWPMQLALDSVNNQLYFADYGAAGDDSIKRMNLNGSGLTTVISNINRPTGLAVNNLRGEIYWSDSSGQLSRADLDGANVAAITTGLYAFEITVDAYADLIYFRTKTDASIHRIGRNGTGLTTLILGNAFHGPALDVANNKLFLIDGAVIGNVAQADLDGGNRSNIGTAGARPSSQLALAFTDAALAPTPTPTITPTPTSTPIGAPPTATPTPLPSPTPGGPPAADTIFWSNHGGEILRAPAAGCLDGTCVQAIVTPSPGTSAGDVDVDSIHDKIYWANSLEGNIQRANLDGSSPETLVSNLTYPLGIAVDPANGYVYWTDYLDWKIQRANLDGSNVITVTTAVKEPRWIDIDEINGVAYFVESAENEASTQESKIRRLLLDGSGIVQDVYVGLNGIGFNDWEFYPFVGGLAVDGEHGRVYWTDHQHGFHLSRLRSVNIDGTDVKTLVRQNYAWNGLAYDRNAFRLTMGAGTTIDFSPPSSLPPYMIQNLAPDGTLSGAAIITTVATLGNQDVNAPLHVALHYPPPPAPICPVDGSEPNNAFGDATAATVATPINNLNFDTGSDEDWFSVTLTGGLRYAIAAQAAGSAADTILDLYATDGTTLLASNDDQASGQTDSEIRFDAPLDGVFYARATYRPGAAAEACDTGYSFSVRLLDAAVLNRLPGIAPSSYIPPVLGSAVLTPTDGTSLNSLAATTVQGAAYANSGIATLNVTLNGAAFYNETPGGVITQTTWSQAWTPAAEGIYTFESVVTDSSSRVQTVTQPVKVFVDLAAPQVTLDRTTLTSTHLVTGSLLLRLSGTANDSLGVGVVEVNINNTVWQPAELSNGQWQLGVLFTGTNGEEHPLQVRVTDLAGKTTTIDATMTTDAQAPLFDRNAIVVTLNGTPISTTRTISAANPTLTIDFPTATDDDAGAANLGALSIVAGYYVGWTTSPTPTLSSLTFYATPGTHTQTLTDNQIYYGHVVAVDSAGNQRAERFGPISIDGPTTPDQIDDLRELGWQQTGGSQVSADREISKGAFSGTGLGVVQKFYLSWNDHNLRLSWNGANWDNDGDLFVYLDTNSGGATQLYNPYPATPGVNIALPSGMNAGFLVWVQDSNTATLLQANGNNWTPVATLDSTRYRFSSVDGTPTTDLLLPFSLLGIDNNTALGVLAVASEDTGLRLWASAPDKNPLNSVRVINPQAIGRTLDTFTLTLYHHWPNLNLGQTPNVGRFADSDLVVTVESLWPSNGAGFLASDLLDLLRFNTPLDGNGDGVIDVALSGAANPQPVGNGLTIQYRIHYANNGPAVAPNVTINLAGSGALNLAGGNVINLGDVAGATSGVVTVTANIGAGTFAELLATVADGPHGVYDFWQYHHPVDSAAPTDVEISTSDFAQPGAQLVTGVVKDASAVPSIELQIRFLPSGTTNTINCTDLTPDDGLWSCSWDAGSLAGVDSVEMQARATDRFGNVSAFSPTLGLAVDLTAPQVTLSAQTEAALADGYINANEASFTGEVVDNRVAQGVTVCNPITDVGLPACARGNALPGNQPNGNWSLALETFDEDAETISLGFAGVDGAGNVSVPFTRTFRVDVVAPVITGTQTNENDSVLRGLVRDGDAVAAVRIRINPPTGLTFWEPATLVGASWAYTPTFATTGVYSLIIEAEDMAGNVSAIGPFTRNVLTTPTSGTIQLVKNTVNGDGLFAFTSTDPDLDAISISTTGGTGSSSVLTKPVGAYTVSEDVQASWSLTNLTCSGDTDNGSLIDLANRQVTIDLDSNEAIVCTFTNTTATGNQAPVAVDDGLPTTSEIVAQGRITLTTLLANDSDPDDTTPADGACTNCSIVATGQGSQGTVTLVGQQVTYVATNPTFRGTDTFTYTLSDNDPRGALTATAQVAVTVQADATPGDCNANGTIDAGDLTALGLEIFDGDGNHWSDAALGSVAFSPYGCDANADAVIDAGDLTCTARRIFDTAFVCGGVTAAQASPASLAIGADLFAQPGDTVDVPIVLTTNGHGVAAAAFSLHWDAAQLQFEATDVNADGTPAAVTFHLPEGLLASATYHAEASRLDLVVLGLAQPLPQLAAGPLVTVRLSVPSESTTASPALSLSTASLGSDTGQSIPLTLTNGTVQTPTQTFQLLLPLVSR